MYETTFSWKIIFLVIIMIAHKMFSPQKITLNYLFVNTAGWNNLRKLLPEMFSRHHQSATFTF